jgi:DNA-binding NtrC family response regulator
MSRGTVKKRIERHLNGLIAAALLGEVPFKEFEDMLRRRIIRASLRRHNGSVCAAAAELNMKRDCLRARLIQLGIPFSARSVAALERRRAA